MAYQVITPQGMKFNQQLFLYQNSKRITRITAKRDLWCFKYENEGGNITNSIIQEK